ncbi:nucleotide exchange factor GrpE, partial [Candidatus Gottesmanbacteria bacterium]|nr:nucleotide exchange factor GrpE [Candidatus Gottesmanbacteria bacterium]
LKKQIEELNNNWKRALADYQNLEKRTLTKIQDSSKYAAETIIVKLLSVLDTLEQAELHLKDQGLTLAIKSFRDVLKEEGVVKIEVIGKKFNPLEMECVEVVEGQNEDEVLDEMRPGYKLYNKVIRVAQVKVWKKKITDSKLSSN